MIYICDAIMGSGKTSAAINYLKAHRADKTIYVTPFLDEVDRILTQCHGIALHTPSAATAKRECGEYAKRKDFERLVRQGKSVVTTHSLFRELAPEITDVIKEQGYTLIVDENLEEIQMSGDSEGETDTVNGFTISDIAVFVRAGDLIETIDYSSESVEIATYRRSEAAKDLTADGKFSEFYKQVEARVLKAYIFKSDGKRTGASFYWMVRPELFTVFNDVIVMTYRFEGQGLYNIFRIFDLKYQYISINKTQRGFFFDFSGGVGKYIPSYTKHIHDMIHIIDDEALNEIGAEENALSVSWFIREDANAASGKGDKIKKLKNNIGNCFRNKWPGSSGGLGSLVGKQINEKRLWSTYKMFQDRLAGAGYSKNFLAFNSKATNDYRNAEYLVYAVNLYYFLPVKFMYNALGIEINDELYALSTMIQWIWRSAIRDGKPVYLYLPSSRMRRILINWMNEISGGGEENRCLSVGTANGMIPISVTRDMAV